MSSISPEVQAKEAALKTALREAEQLVVAFSGGVDSSYLAVMAHRVLREKALAVTAISPSYPQAHREMAERIVAEFGIAHRFVTTREMSSPSYRANGPDRCYHCKSELFERLGEIAAGDSDVPIAYGINTDDTSDFRPGHRAAQERAVRAPLLDAGLSKTEIRDLSREAGLPTADLPSSACLSSRLPYGTEVTIKRLNDVEEGEARLRQLGFQQVRLRHHGERAGIEIDPTELARALEPEVTRAIEEAILPLGFREVWIDPKGYRTGSLNEVLFAKGPAEG